MEIAQKNINQFWILAQGCTRHMPYRAKREPTNECSTCHAMWEAKVYLEAHFPQAAEELPPDINFTPDPRCAFCAEGVPHLTGTHLRSIRGLSLAPSDVGQTLQEESGIDGSTESDTPISFLVL